MSISLQKRKNIVNDLEKGIKFRIMANKYNVAISTIYRVCILEGKPKRWRLSQIQEKKDTLKVEIAKELCVLPNLRQVCKQRKLNYFNFITRTDFRAKSIKCYTDARNKCRICGIDITGRIWWRRLCSIHVVSERQRQNKLLALRGKARKTRKHKYYSPVGVN